MRSALLDEALTEGGIRALNYFHGRLLTAEDLREEQRAAREADRLLGRVAGDGVARGLRVKAGEPGANGRPTVEVTAGLAVNRLGDVLHLPEDTRVTLDQAPPAVTTAACAKKTFGDCGGLTPGAAASPGVFCLCLTSATADSGRVPVVGGDPRSAACAVRYRVGGVGFRLVAITDAAIAQDRLSAPDRLRNRLAYRAFGTFDLGWEPLVADPFGPFDASPDLLSELFGAGTLTPADVPLAFVHVETSGLRFVDTWAARRRPSRSEASNAVEALASDRRLRIAEAALGQFQDHPATLLLRADAATLGARNYFDYFPPAGLIPIKSEVPGKAFSTEFFFQGVAVRPPEFLEGGQAEAVLRASFSYPPIKLETGEFMRTYAVRQNAAGSARTYLLFASGHIPPRIEPFVDLAHVDFMDL